MNVVDGSRSATPTRPDGESASGPPGGRRDLAAAGVAVLRTRGERVTPARRAVLRVLAGTSAHLSVDDVYARAEQIVPGLHRTTVYRAVETLGELGLVTHVHPDHGPAVYHLAPALTGRGHLHVRCRACGEILDVPADLLDDVARRLAATVGFALQPDHAALTGLCRACSALASA